MHIDRSPYPWSGRLSIHSAAVQVLVDEAEPPLDLPEVEQLRPGLVVPPEDVVAKDVGGVSVGDVVDVERDHVAVVVGVVVAEDGVSALCHSSDVVQRLARLRVVAA